MEISSRAQKEKEGQEKGFLPSSKVPLSPILLASSRSGILLENANPLKKNNNGSDKELYSPRLKKKRKKDKYPKSEKSAKENKREEKEQKIPTLTPL